MGIKVENRDPRWGGPRPPQQPEQEQPFPGRETEMEPRPDHGEERYVGHGRLDGQRALITGGDSGIGRAVALAFAREGAHVSFCYLESEQPDADETRRLVEESGRVAVLTPGDVGEPEFCRHLVERTARELGGIDILVNNAAFQGPETRSLDEYNPARVEHTFRVNIMAMFHLVRFAVQHMQPGASVINVSSIEAYQPKPYILDYATTKGAIISFTKGLAHDLVERGIRANVVAPGAVWTPLVAQSFEPAHVAKHGKVAPVGRAAQPYEMAPAFVYLASDEARYVTGEVLGVTGGVILP